jgi:hypothetical protein
MKCLFIIDCVHIVSILFTLESQLIIISKWNKSSKNGIRIIQSSETESASRSSIKTVADVGADR